MVKVTGRQLKSQQYNTRPPTRRSTIKKPAKLACKML